MTRFARLKKISDSAIIPTKAYDGDLGWDIYSDQDVEIPTGATIKVSSGISMTAPDGYGFLLKERSSLGARGLAIRGGVIDSSYTGEWFICITNTNVNNVNYVIKKGDKICQAILVKNYDLKITEVSELKKSDRSDKGFGSSGV